MEQRTRYIAGQALRAEEQVAQMLECLAEPDLVAEEWRATIEHWRRQFNGWARCCAREVTSKEPALIEVQVRERLYDVLRRISSGWPRQKRNGNGLAES